LNSNPSVPRPALASSRAFKSLANRDFRYFFFTATAAMMADNVEHVISYFVVFQKFHSPALLGFAVVSHWVPYLILGGFTGRLADRFGPRRLIQTGMLLFMGVSITWGVMFLTDSTTMWMSMLLLVVHGLAAVLWVPASQVLIHDMVRAEELPSAVRIFATGRYLGFVTGPAVGAGLLLGFGAAYGILINALIYVPLFAWLIYGKYGSAAVDEPARPLSVSGFADMWATLKVVAKDPVLSSMTVLIGASAFFVGNAYQAQMPGFAFALGHDRGDFAYGALLAADAAGGLTAGVVLESRGLLPPKVRTAFILAMIWCCALAGFARSHIYALSIALLFVAGFVELAFNAMAQALVQMNAPGAIRGRVIGVFAMFAMGLRTFSGLSVGLLGSLIGIHNSLSYSAAALFLLYVAIIAVHYAGGASVSRRLP
jgi:MFS family permease